jgi:hypothetical protein
MKGWCEGNQRLLVINQISLQHTIKNIQVQIIHGEALADICDFIGISLTMLNNS